MWTVFRFEVTAWFLDPTAIHQIFLQDERKDKDAFAVPLHSLVMGLSCCCCLRLTTLVKLYGILRLGTATFSTFNHLLPHPTLSRSAWSVRDISWMRKGGRRQEGFHRFQVAQNIHQQIYVSTQEIIHRPRYCLPYMQPGRLIKVTVSYLPTSDSSYSARFVANRSNWLYCTHALGFFRWLLMSLLVTESSIRSVRAIYWMFVLQVEFSRSWGVRSCFIATAVTSSLFQCIAHRCQVMPGEFQRKRRIWGFALQSLVLSGPCRFRIRTLVILDGAWC